MILVESQPIGEASSDVVENERQQKRRSDIILNRDFNSKSRPRLHSLKVCSDALDQNFNSQKVFAGNEAERRDDDDDAPHETDGDDLKVGDGVSDFKNADGKDVDNVCKLEDDDNACNVVGNVEGVSFREDSNGVSATEDADMEEVENFGRLSVGEDVGNKFHLPDISFNISDILGDFFSDDEDDAALMDANVRGVQVKDGKKTTTSLPIPGTNTMKTL